MRLDFIHHQLARSQLDLASKQVATCIRSSYTLKNAIKQKSELIELDLFRYGVANLKAIDELKAQGVCVVVEPFEIDTFFINQVEGLDLIVVDNKRIDPIVQKDLVLEFLQGFGVGRFLDGDNPTLENGLLIRLPKIKARSLVNALRIDEIYITNSEACSLTLGTPSLVLQSYGFSEDLSREAIGLSWSAEATKDEIFSAIEKMLFRYKQIRSLGR